MHSHFYLLTIVICRAKNLAKGRRHRFARAVYSSVHETVITGYALDGSALPPVWVLNRKTIDAETRFTHARTHIHT